MSIVISLLHVKKPTYSPAQPSSIAINVWAPSQIGSTKWMTSGSYARY
jgi:hypothetical protein